MNIRLLLIALLATALAACDSADDAAETSTPATEAVVEATAETATEETAEAAAELEALTEEAEEVVDEVVPEAEDDSEEIVLSSAPASDSSEPRDWQYSEGEYFRRMTTAQGTSSAPEKIEVAEVFWYGCPHCYDFDPIIAEWKTTLDPDVAFVRIPVIWNPTNQLHARIMYTAEALEVLDKAHPAMFKAIHQEGNSLTKEDDIVAFFAKLGVEEDQFREAYNSFTVSSSVKRAENLTRRYGVRSVPVMIINGKYATDAPGIKTFDDVLNVTAELVERERVGD